jgi:glycosyltransferase involved in cell wall biosynthesis
MGHLCSDKGTPNLIKAVAALRMDYPNIILELAGEPLAPYSNESLMADIADAGLEDHVKLLGMISGQEKQQAFGRADIFVFPSIAPYESFGLVMVEAMMWGIPIVASQWRGNSDILKNSEGSQTFEPAKCAKALEECLRYMLLKKEQWPTMGQANRALFLEHYDQRSGKYNLANYLLELV